MSLNTRTLLAVAAEMRAIGYAWAAIAAEVNRKPDTCQKWPSRYRDDWDDVYRAAQRRRLTRRAPRPTGCSRSPSGPRRPGSG
jgi:hypothetical protein